MKIREFLNKVIIFSLLLTCSMDNVYAGPNAVKACCGCFMGFLLLFSPISAKKPGIYMENDKGVSKLLLTLQDFEALNEPCFAGEPVPERLADLLREIDLPALQLDEDRRFIDDGCREFMTFFLRSFFDEFRSFVNDYKSFFGEKANQE